MATHSGILAWRISWTEETVYGLCHIVYGVAESDTLNGSHFHWQLKQCSYLLQEKQRISRESGLVK